MILDEHKQSARVDDQGRTSGAANAGQASSPSAGNGDASLVLPPDALILIPVRNMVLFPGIVLPISIGREKSVAAAQAAARAERPVGIVLQRNPEEIDPSPAELHEIGTTANILRYITGQDGTHHVICQGVERFRIVEFLDGYPFHVARIERIPESEPQPLSAELEARLHQLKE